MSRSQSSVHGKLHMYAAFAGLDTSRSDIALENKEAQAIVSSNGIHVDRRGFLMNERAIEQVGDERGYITHVRQFSSRENDLMYAARTGRGTSLRSTRSPSDNEEDVWPRDAVPASSVFNRRVVFTAAEQAPKVNDGYGWVEITSPTARGARFSAPVQGRLALAGFSNNPNEVRVSRVNNENVMPEDEAEGDTSVIKAHRLNVENLIGTSDEITGLAAYETNKLAIFTNDRVLVYVADVDYTKWELDERVNINVGTFSHNTISAATNGDLLFCARSGVYSLRRSSMNGITMISLPLSDQVSELYRSLYESVLDKRQISAVFDRDDGRYHIMFPVSEFRTMRLTLAMNPQVEEAAQVVGRWSLSEFGGLTCGDALAGRMIFGSIAGFQRMLPERDDGNRGDGVCQLPVLWHGDISEPKRSHSILLYASGVGRVSITAHDETKRELGTIVFDLPSDDQTDYIGVPLSDQFERPFSFTYVGLRLEVTIQATSQVRIFGIGIRTKEL